MNWRKSSHSFSNGNCIEVTDWRKPRRSAYNGDCVEAGDWRKASQSNSGACVEAADWRTAGLCQNGECVEVASGVAVRDTQDREGPVLTFSAPEWRAFTDALKGGRR